MPTIKVELQIGKDKNTLIKLRDLILDSVVEILKLPEDERNIRIIEYQQDMFLMKPPYEILIEIYLFIGRSRETKKKLYNTIVERLESNGIIEKEKIFIILNEVQSENWAIRNGIPPDEIDLGFKIII